MDWTTKTAADEVAAAHINALQDHKVDKDRQMFNVRDYGAKGDDDDDNTALQTLLASLSAGEGMFFPEGIYTLTSELLIALNYFTLCGEGRGSILKTANPANNIIKVQGTAAWPNDLRACMIKNLAFYGPNSGTGSAIWARRIHESIFRNLFLGEVDKGIGYGIRLPGGANGGYQDADNNIIANNQITRIILAGIKLEGAGGCEENTIIGNVISYAGVNGISCLGDRNTLIGNTVEECEEDNIIIAGKWNAIIGNTVCESRKHGIRVIDYDENTIIGNIIKDNDFNNLASYHGIYLQNSDRNIIMGNRCRDNDKYEIYLDANSDNNSVIGNHVYGTDHVNTIIDSGANNRIRDNVGFVSENSGLSGAIATGATIAHGLDGTPVFASVAAAEAGPTDIHISVGAANITVNFGGGGNKTFFWRASLAQSK